MRRTVTIAVTLGALVAAAAAYAALNTYTGNFSFSGKAGSKKAPAAVGYTQTYGAANATSGEKAAPLIKIVTKIYGLQTNGKAFPKCSLATIEKSPKFNGNCPPRSLIASGRVNSVLLPGGNLAQKGSPCNPYLAVYNGGQNVQNFFFYVKTGTDCAGLHTGAALPWPGTIKTSGGYAVETVPLPPDISTKAGNLNGVYGSLLLEKLTYAKLTTKVKGKTVGYNESIGCKSGKRPWSMAFTATDKTGVKETKSVSGSAKC